MARPPRIPVMLPWECKVIYFLTICITPRRNGLANDAAWTTVCETLKQLDKWNTYCVMTMPDHIHFLTSPADRELSVASFLRRFKRWFTKSYGAREEWRWQPGGGVSAGAFFFPRSDGAWLCSAPAGAPPRGCPPGWP